MSIPMPLNFKKWIDDNRHLLKPPVGNREVYEDGEFIIMVVGGPNNRKDYHYNTTPEFFYQLEGDIIVKTMQDGKRVDYDIKEGDIFLLPSKYNILTPLIQTNGPDYSDPFINTLINLTTRLQLLLQLLVCLLHLLVYHA